MSTLDGIDNGLVVASLVMILVAGALLLVRIWRGPSMLDRAIALDVAAALIIAGLAVKAVHERTGYYLPIMLVLSFLGFTSSVGIARFIAARDRIADRSWPESESDERAAARDGEGEG